MNVVSKKCEECGDKMARLRLPGEGKKQRWCGDCAPRAAHAEWRRTHAADFGAGEGDEEEQKKGRQPGRSRQGLRIGLAPTSWG